MTLLIHVHRSLAQEMTKIAVCHISSIIGNVYNHKTETSTQSLNLNLLPQNRPEIKTKRLTFACALPTMNCRQTLIWQQSFKIAIIIDTKIV